MLYLFSLAIGVLDRYRLPYERGGDIISLYCMLYLFSIGVLDRYRLPYEREVETL